MKKMFLNFFRKKFPKALTSEQFAEIILIIYLIDVLLVCQEIYSFMELKCKTKLLQGFIQTLV